MSIKPKTSLIIPVYNEGDNIQLLLTSIAKQSHLPDEVIVVDGGSTDNTVEEIQKFKSADIFVRLLQVERAMPGEGRNIGTKAATHEWIVYTDAGIKLDNHWLQKLVNTVLKYPNAEVVYGNYSPITDSLFEKSACIAYVPPLKPGKIRGEFIASSILKKDLWMRIGGFPAWRAAEDIIFMEKARENARQIIHVPDAFVYWNLRPDFNSTYKKFDLYSMHNIWAKRQHDWHYGILRQYILLLMFLIAGIFLHWVLFLLIPLWLIARTAKRILAHKFEFGRATLFNPLVFFMVTLISIVIDAATFSGWIKAYIKRRYS